MQPLKAVAGKALAVALIGSGLSLASVGVAGAAPALGPVSGVSGSPGLAGASGVSGTTGSNGKIATVQTRLEAAVSARQARLSKLTTVVDSDTFLTANDRTTLHALLQGEINSVDAVAMQLASDTTRQSLLAAATQLYNDNRVFAVMTPKVNLVDRSDRLIARIAKLQARVPSTDTAALSVLSKTSTTVAEIHDQVLAQSPSGYPGNESVFSNARHTLQQAEVAIASLVQSLRGLHHGASSQEHVRGAAV